MLDSLRTTIFASLGVITLAQEKLRSCVDDLVKKGDLSREQGDRVVSVLAEKGKDGSREISDKLSHEIQSLIQRTPFVARTEFRDLESRVTALESGSGSEPTRADGDEAEPTVGS